MSGSGTDALYQSLDDMGVEVFVCPLSRFKALASPDGYLGINPYVIDSRAEELEILMHEEAHFATNTFYQYDSAFTVRRHQEHVALRFAIEKHFPVSAIRRAIRQGNTELWELAEHFGVTDAYMADILQYYQDSKGITFFGGAK